MAFKIVIIIHILFNKKNTLKNNIEINTLVNGCNNLQFNTIFNGQDTFFYHILSHSKCLLNGCIICMLKTEMLVTIYYAIGKQSNYALVFTWSLQLTV